MYHVDPQKKRWVDLLLKHLIEQRGYFVADRDIESLMNKFDKGQHRGAIIQSEFISEMVPK
jgi:hypothetical protein